MNHIIEIHFTNYDINKRLKSDYNLKITKLKKLLDFKRNSISRDITFIFIFIESSFTFSDSFRKISVFLFLSTGPLSQT